MKTKMTGGLIAPMLVALLFASNPDESKFTAWVMNRMSEKIATMPKPKNAWEEMGRAAGMAMLPQMVRSVSVREDWLLFSLYRGQGDWKGALVLGIGGKFIGLANRTAS